jgi:formate hydrogenlyase subunit 5
VANARFGVHKERVLRLVARMCGSRFGRGVVRPGGVCGPPLVPPSGLLSELARLEADIRRDAELLMDTPSFLDRLRGTGPLSLRTAEEYGALGPVGRGSGFVEDVRHSRPYAAYGSMRWAPADAPVQGDALARLRVRWDEVWASFHLAREAEHRLQSRGTDSSFLPVEGAEGRAFGWAEAPQGEVLYLVELRDGRVSRCKPRSASFHNLVLLPQVFRGDILTDFAFIEASFGLSIAGVSL